MLELDVNKVKTLDFEIQLSSIDPSQLEGALRIMIDGIEHGFRAEITPTNIIVNIPKLKSILRREFKDGEEFEAKLEAHGAGYYLNPWKGTFVVKNPVSMEVKIKEDIVQKPPSAVAKTKEHSVQSSLVSESQNVVDQGIVRESNEKQVTKRESPQTHKKNLREDTRSRPLKPNVKITEKHILAYMASKGTKNKSVQKVLLEQCKARAISKDPLDVLREVVKFYKKKNKSN